METLGRGRQRSKGCTKSEAYCGIGLGVLLCDWTMKPVWEEGRSRRSLQSMRGKASGLVCGNSRESLKTGGRMVPMSMLAQGNTFQLLDSSLRRKSWQPLSPGTWFGGVNSVLEQSGEGLWADRSLGTVGGAGTSGMRVGSLPGKPTARYLLPEGLVALGAKDSPQEIYRLRRVQACKRYSLWLRETLGLCSVIALSFPVIKMGRIQNKVHYFVC